MIRTGAFVPLKGKTQKVHNYFKNSILSEHAETIITELVTEESSDSVQENLIINIAINWINSHEGQKFNMTVDTNQEITVTPIYDNNEQICWDIGVAIS